MGAGSVLHGSSRCPGAEFKSIMAVAASMSDSGRGENTSVMVSCVWGLEARAARGAWEGGAGQQEKGPASCLSN